MHMHVSEIATQLPGTIINGGTGWGWLGKVGKHGVPYSNSLKHSSWNKVREDLLGDKWKLAKHQILGKLYSTSVLGSLGETEPTVVGKLWDAAIMIVFKTEVCNKGAWLCGCGFQWFVSVFVQSWSDNVSIEKTVLPGVWSLLDGGGYGSPKITYPCLLPLLSKLVGTVD